MITAPVLGDRAEVSYVGIRTQVPMKEMENTIPQLLGEVFAWLEERGVAPAGAPFMRLHVIDMASDMDIELCVPVATSLTGDDRVRSGTVPEGRYASLVYTGDGIEANGALIDWATENGIEWDRWDDEKGDAFRSRIETFLTDPDEEPDRSKWETEVAIKVAAESK